jgi:hypothetical protein
VGEAAVACLQEVGTVLGPMYIAQDHARLPGRLPDLLRVVGVAGIAVVPTILTHLGRARDPQDEKELADTMIARRDVAVASIAMTTEVDPAAGDTIPDSCKEQGVITWFLFGVTRREKGTKARTLGFN